MLVRFFGAAGGYRGSARQGPLSNYVKDPDAGARGAMRRPTRGLGLARGPQGECPGPRCTPRGQQKSVSAVGATGEARTKLRRTARAWDWHWRKGPGRGGSARSGCAPRRLTRSPCLRHRRGVEGARRGAARARTRNQMGAGPRAPDRRAFAGTRGLRAPEPARATALPRGQARPSTLRRFPPRQARAGRPAPGCFVLRGSAPIFSLTADACRAPRPQGTCGAGPLGPARASRSSRRPRRRSGGGRRTGSSRRRSGSAPCTGM